MRTILLVDKDKDTAKDLKAFLLEYEYNVIVAKDEIEARAVLVREMVDLIIISISAKNSFGLDIIANFRSINSDVPIIIITNRNDIESKIIAFNSGANDLIVRPYNNYELIARISNQLRYNKKVINQVFVNGDLTIDYNRRVVYMQNHEVHLTNLEFKILSLLAQNLDHVLTYDFMIILLKQSGEKAVKTIMD